MRGLKLLRAVILSLAVMSAPGCTQQSAHDARPVTLEGLREYLRSASEAASRGREDAIAECMAKQGFNYSGAEFEDATPDVRTASPYGFSSSWRESIKAILAPATPDTAGPLNPELATEAYYIALTGSADGAGTGGCRGEAEQLRSPQLISTEVLSEIDVALSDLRSKPAYTAALDDWATCLARELPDADTPTSPENVDQLLQRYLMRAASKRGLDATSPLTLSSGDSGAIDSVLTEVAEFESALAAADKDCQQSSGLTDLQDQALQIVLDELPPDFFNATVPVTTTSSD